MEKMKFYQEKHSLEYQLNIKEASIKIKHTTIIISGSSNFVNQLS